MLKNNKTKSDECKGDDEQQIENKSSHRSFESIKIEFERFRENNEKCKGYDDCPHLLRMIFSLKHYQKFTSESDKDDESNRKHLFIQFCIDQYKMCLDDYIHFICVHCDELHKITDGLESKCSDINQCKWTQRHYRERGKNVDNDNNDNNDDKYNFYVEMFDTIHFYLFHLEDLGLRILNKQQNKIKNENKNDERDDIDKDIIFIQNEIEMKRKKYGLQFNRLNNNNNTKFIIQQTGHDIITSNKDEDVNGDPDKTKPDGAESTFIDDMLTNIHDNNVVDEVLLKHLSIFIDQEEYDTDCIGLDIDIFDDDTNCNILHSINNDIKCIEYIKQFQKYTKLSSNSFSTGFAFFYHSYYKDLDLDINLEKKEKIKNQQESYAEEDFGGVSLSDLFVAARYDSIKEEALCSSYLTFKVFTKVIVKGDQFIESQKCKQIKALYSGDPLHFGIRRRTPLRKSHLYALILYCDYTDFCTAFSATFRKKKWNESMKLLVQRNSKYHHISKNLMELIQYYGVSNNIFDREAGPFYTGLSFCMNIPEFSIKLNGPTSSSKQKEIASRFATRDGLIIQLNNCSMPGHSEMFFNTSWISAFPEEDERLFFAARYKIEIESIIVMKTKVNYERYMNAFFKFDAMVSGFSIGRTQSIDVTILRSAIKYVLDDVSNTDDDDYLDLDGYIQDNFYLFTRNKTQIILSLIWIGSTRNNLFNGLIMHSVQNDKETEIEDNNRNLFKPIIFELFPKLQRIIIHSSSSGDYGMQTVYSFNLLSLLSILSKYSFPKSLKSIIIKDPRECWLENSFTEQIKQKFNEKKLNIEFKRGGVRQQQDWVIITLQ